MVKTEAFTTQSAIGQGMRDGIHFFDLWQSAAAARTVHPVSAESAKRYRSTWLSFLLWLPISIHWTKASSGDVVAYLKQIEPSASTGSRTVGRQVNGASDVKVHRCWRLLRDIFSHATHLEVCKENPCLKVPNIPAEKTVEAVALTGWEKQSLAHFVMKRLENDTALGWRALCKDVLLLTLALTGMTCSEVVRLRSSNLAFMRGAGLSASVVISVDGDRSRELRSITIDHPVYVRLLRKWSQWHAQIDNAPPELFFGGKPKTVRLRKMHTPLTAKAASTLVAEALAASENLQMQFA